jgi:hypothetical protein
LKQNVVCLRTGRTIIWKLQNNKDKYDNGLGHEWSSWADVEQLSSKINKALAQAIPFKILRVTIGNWTIISNLYYFKKIIIPTMEKKTNTKFIIILVAW